MNPADRKLRRVLFFICLAVYLAGMAVIIGVEISRPLRAITDVKYALGAYCLIVATCLAAMFAFSHRLESSTKRRA
jgi:uncharacterized membrane protein